MFGSFLPGGADDEEDALLLEGGAVGVDEEEGVEEEEEIDAARRFCFNCAFFCLVENAFFPITTFYSSFYLLTYLLSVSCFLVLLCCSFLFVVGCYVFARCSFFVSLVLFTLSVL